MSTITPEQEHWACIRFCAVTRPYVFNAFINAPSTQQIYHPYHGVQGVAIVTRRFKKDKPTTATFHFGNTTVHDVPLMWLSKLY
jgi:hypothetical protein